MNTHECWLCPTCRKAEQIWNSLTSVDGKLIRSLLALVAKPGALTVAYLQGRRKPYLGPVPLFLMALFGGPAATAPWVDPVESSTLLAACAA